MQNVLTEKTYDELIRSESLYDISKIKDLWILHQRVKECKIIEAAAWLFDNLRIWFLEIGPGENLPKKNREVKMSLYKQKRSRYIYINISYGGKRTRVSSRCENKRDANKVKLLVLARLMQTISPTNQMIQDISPSPKPALPTFADASGQYLKEMCEGRKIAWKREEQCHRDLIPFFGERRIDQITSRLVLQWLKEETQRVVRGGKQISPRSVNYNLGYLKRFFNYAVKIQEWVKDNPVSIVDPVSQGDKRDRKLVGDEEQKLLDACEHEWVRRILTFGIETGFRVGEVSSLKTGEFHLDEEIPHFKKKREKNKLITEFPVVSERLATVIEEQISIFRTTDHFFTDEKGIPVSIHKIGHCFRKAVAKAGIENLIFGDLRRTFYSKLRDWRCNVISAEYLMGHKVAGIASHYLVNTLVDVYEELKRVEETKKSRVIHLSYLEEKETLSVPVLTV